MHLNLPIEVGNNILFAGIGGGYDVYGSIPIYETLKWHRPHEPFLSFFFSNYNITSKETYIESNFTKVIGQPVEIIPKTGVKPMLQKYKEIVEKNKIDTVILVDGGVDSLMHGDEEGAGTFLEDLVSMVAIGQLQVPGKYGEARPVKRILACVGFGTEMEEGLCHFSALENMAEIIKKGGFYGCCALTKDMNGYSLYKECCEKAWEENRASHVQSKIISAVEGRFGDNNMYGNVDAMVLGKKVDNFISPLMSIYWFFDLDIVLEGNYLADKISNTNTYTDVLMLMRQSIGKKKLRNKKVIPY